MMITSTDDSDDNDDGDEDSHDSGDAENEHDDCASGLSTRVRVPARSLEGLDGSYWYKGEKKGFCGLDDLKWPLGRTAKMFPLDLAS